VNPTELDLPVKTDKRCRDVSSGRVGSEFVIPSQDGRILVPSSAAPKPGTLAEPAPAFTLRGAKGLLRRDGRILWRMSDDVAAVLRDDGVLLALYVDGQAVARNVRAVMVSSPNWKDFAYAGARLAAHTDSALTFTGRRTEKESAADYRLTVKWSDGALQFDYEFTAATDLEIHAFRHQVALPVSVFSGGKATAGAKTIGLPGDAPRGGPFVRSAKRVALASADGLTHLEAASSGAMGLHDERVYGADAFLLTQSPIRGTVKAGTKWRFDLKLRPAGTAGR
ncbi:hypothetical protein LCGC14_2727930, partial [marine sediment metagenome]